MTTHHPRRILATAGAALAAAILLAGCSGGSQPHVTAAAQSASADVLACQHYQAQREKFRGNATPTLADMAMLAGWIGEDAVLATDPALKRDFSRASDVITKLLSDPRYKPPDIKMAISRDCARHGVTIGH